MIVWIEYTATHLLGTFFNDYQQKKAPLIIALTLLSFSTC